MNTLHKAPHHNAPRQTIDVSRNLKERRKTSDILIALEQRKEVRRLERRKRIAKRLTAIVLLPAAIWGGYKAYNQHNHREGAATKAQIRAMLDGRVPEGIQRIVRTDNPDVQKVHYVVQPGEPYESNIAANLHPMAINQTQDEEDAMLDTYLPPRDRANHSVYSGEELDVFVDTHRGEILPNPSEK